MAEDQSDLRSSTAPRELESPDVYRFCDASIYSFETTADLPELDEIIGQERAVTATDFGIQIRSQGYNIFALGPTGTGKESTMRRFLSREASSEDTPSDWVYVENFARPHQPSALRLPAATGCQLRDDMEKLVDDLQMEITRAFESDEYEKKRREITQKVNEQQEAKLDDLRDRADEQGFTMVRTPAGLAFAPKTEEGETMSRDEYKELPEDRQEEIDRGLSDLNEELQQVMRQVRQDERGGREALRELDREVTNYAAKHLIDELRDQWREHPEVGSYLDSVLQDVVDNAEDFKTSEDDQQQQLMSLALGGRRKETTFRRYRVNVLVDHSETEGAPVVSETNPTLQNLNGRVEHQAQFGTLVTDFNMIKSGALHRANGGYLMIEARELLLRPFAWDTLKRTLKTGEIRIEDIAQQMGWAATSTLEPEPIPFSGKIVLTGEPMLYYLLYTYDPDFPELFKVKVDFDVLVERDEGNEELYALFVSQVCRNEDLPPFSPDGVARIVEHGSRLVADRERLSVRFVDICDTIRESAYWAIRGNGGPDEALVEREHVDKAIDQRIYRSNRIEERIREMIADGTVMVDTAGEAIGQVNGLSVLQLGEYAFGRPSRITATHRLGDGEVIDIEREVEMGGPIHAKGVMILAGYLGARFASDQPLSLSARLVFEQSYSGVEGDSASSAELYSLLSSLSGLPIRQRYAVTGSVNQHGRIQAIGGVNEKIEGYFAVCKELGLQGDEGVLIPESNVRHLMLRPEVREAVEAGTFHIHPVSTVDEGITILTGVEAGQAQEDGSYPDGTVNALVAARLSSLAERARELSTRPSASPDAPDDAEENP